MIKNRKSGFALLLALFITTGLTLLAITFWYKTSLNFDLVLQKEQYYKNYYLTKAGLDYGAELVKNNFNILKEKLNFKKADIILDLSELIKISQDFDYKNYKNLNLKLVISKYKTNDTFDTFLLNSTLCQSNNLVCNLVCLVERVLQEDNVLPNQNKNRFCFVVKNFTISPIV